jgi:hypothetical protein
VHLLTVISVRHIGAVLVKVTNMPVYVTLMTSVREALCQTRDR